MAKLMEDSLHGWSIIKDMSNNVQEVMVNGELLLMPRYESRIFFFKYITVI